MARFSIDLAGRIRNFDLPKTKPLIPLLEAVVNSIYAIEERQKLESVDGQIDIIVVREPQTFVDALDQSILPITGFKIIDNGVGFNENNMRSFLQSDSTYRAAQGGKGVGRFAWLKAFQTVHVDSVFPESSGWMRRHFDFDLSGEEIDDRLEDISWVEDNRTTVELCDYLPKYQTGVPRNGKTIATRIMQHCFIYLMSSQCPQIIVHDDLSYCVNNMFRETIQREKNSRSFVVGNTDFEILHTKIADKSLRNSKLYLFANDRMVQEINLETEIADLDYNLFNERGYFYVGVLSGRYFDANVNSNRSTFDLPETSDMTGPSLDDIVKEAAGEVKEYLADYLDSIQQEKMNRIQTYIRTQAPQFMHLLKYMPHEIARLKPALSDAKLNDALHQIKHKFDIQLKQENQDIIRLVNVGTTNWSNYQNRFKLQFEKISDANKAALAEYVAHRKVVLDLLEKGICLNDDRTYNKELYIHNLIYPMHQTSEDIEYGSHNLWLIDERLAFCDYISSDIPFNNDRRESRTDIMILDHPVAVSDERNIGREYETIIIFELKRPIRDDYTTAENPIQQLLGYVDEIRTNRKTDKNGRPIHVGNNTQYFLYAICDLTPSMQKVADHHDFKETVDRRGMYRYHENMHAYIEIIPYDKLIENARKRNQILFDKLGI